MEYPTPQQFYELIESFTTERDRLTKTIEFLRNLPKKDKTDIFINHIFYSLLIPNNYTKFIKMGLEPDEPYLVWIDSYASLQIRNKAVKRLKNSGWTQKYPSGEIYYPYPQKERECKQKKIIVKLESSLIDKITSLEN